MLQILYVSLLLLNPHLKNFCLGACGVGRNKDLKCPQIKFHLPYSQAIQRDYHTYMDHQIKAFFIWLGEKQIKHQTFSILTVQVLDTIT